MVNCEQCPRGPREEGRVGLRDRTFGRERGQTDDVAEDGRPQRGPSGRIRVGERNRGHQRPLFTMLKLSVTVTMKGTGTPFSSSG